MSIHFLTKTIQKTALSCAAVAVFLASFSVVKAETIYQAPSLITRMSQSLGSESIGYGNNSNAGMVLEAFQVKVPVFPLGYVYPIAQLGNCSNAQECYVYCEDPKNISVCATVASQQGYINGVQARKAIKLGQMIAAGYMSNCTTMNECVKLCDNVNAQSDCQRLAMEINNSSAVLGANTQDNFLGRSIFETCDGFDNCGSLANQSVLGSTYNQMAMSGQLPAGCYDGQQCFQYCLQNSSVGGCSQFISSIGGLTGDISGMFRASNLFSGGLTYEQILNNNLDGGYGYEYGAGGGFTSVPPTQPQINISDMQSCIYNNQRGLDLETITPEQYNLLNQRNSECQKQFTPQVDANQITQQGTQKAVNGINSVSQCLINSTNIAQDISQCLALSAN